MVNNGSSLGGQVDSFLVAPMFREGHRRAVDLARHRLGDEAFNLAWTEGRAMPMEAAIGIALEPEED